MDQLIQFTPVSLRFDITLHEQTYTNLRVRNVSGERLAFKVKTTCVQRYLVRPSCALIDPDAVVDVAFGLKSFAAPPDDLYDCRDRFQLLVARLSDVPRGADDGADDSTHGFVSVQALWSSVQSDVVHREKLPVELHLVHSESPAKPKPKQHPSLVLQEATLPSVSIIPDNPVAPPTSESPSLPKATPAPDPTSPLSVVNSHHHPPAQQASEGNTAGSSMAGAVLAAMRANRSSVAVAPRAGDDEPAAENTDTMFDDQFDEDDESLAVPYAMQPGNGFSSFAAVAAAISSKPKTGLDAVSTALGSLAAPKADKVVPEIGDVPVHVRYTDDEDDDESTKTPILIPTPPPAPSPRALPSFAKVAELAQPTMAKTVPEPVLPPPPTAPPPPPPATTASPVPSVTPQPSPVPASQSPTKPVSAIKPSISKRAPAPAPLSASASKPTVSSSAKTPATVTAKPSSQPPQKEPEDNIDYTSIDYARGRALDINVTHVAHVPELDRATRYRVAVERAGELSRVIEHKLRVIDNLHKQLVEARHRLSDARLATHPAYDVRFEISESGRIPISQICVMWLITCALLQLLL